MVTVPEHNQVARGGVHDLPNLTAHGLGVPGMGVTHADSQDAAEEIQVLPPASIPHPRPVALDQHHGLGVIRAHVGEEVCLFHWETSPRSICTPNHASFLGWSGAPHPHTLAIYCRTQ